MQQREPKNVFPGCGQYPVHSRCDNFRLDLCYQICGTVLFQWTIQWLFDFVVGTLVQNIQLCRKKDQKTSQSRVEYDKKLENLGVYSFHLFLLRRFQSSTYSLIGNAKISIHSLKAKIIQLISRYSSITLGERG